MGTLRKWRRVKEALRAEGRAVPGHVTPDPGTDFTAPTTGAFPSIEDMESWVVTETKWAALSWSPVVTPVHEADGSWSWQKYREPGVSRKPTWTVAMRIFQRWMRSTFLPQVIGVYASRHIARVYHPDAGEDRNKEWEVRFGGGDMTKKDAERKRMIAVCHALEAQVKAAATLAQLEAIDYHSDSVWAPPAGDRE